MSLMSENSTPPILLPCTICYRTFKPESLAKHTKVCERTLMKKRKKFDSSKQRIQGTELAEFLPMLSKSTKIDRSPVRKVDSSWKEKHLELMETIQAARQLPSEVCSNICSRERIRKLTDQEACPYCDRSFGPKAYDRHLEWCKDRTSRILPKSTASVVAKERLEARTKYQAPRLRQSLRARTREKYSPHRHRQLLEKKPNLTDISSKKESLNLKSPSKETSETAFGDKGTSTRKQPNPSVRAKNVDKPISSNNKSASNLPAQPSAKRSSTSNRLGPPVLKKLDSSSNNLMKTSVKTLQKQSSSTTNTKDPQSDAGDYDPYTSAEQQMKELLGFDFDKGYPNLKDLPSPSPLLTPIPLNRKLKSDHSAENLLNNAKPNISSDLNIKKVNNFIDEKNSLNISLSSANLDLIFGEKSIESELINSKIESLETLSDEELTVPISDLVIKDSIETDLKRTPVSIGCSPTSAFAKYSPSPPHVGNENLLKALNNPPATEVSNFSNFEKNERNVDKYPHVNMSSISLCSTVSLDSNIDFNKNKRGSNDNTFAPDVNHKVSKASETHKEGRNICRTLLNMEQMLFGISSNSSNKNSRADNRNNNRGMNKNLANSKIDNKVVCPKVEKSNPNYNLLYPKMNLDTADAAELELVESISELENMYLFFPISENPTSPSSVAPFSKVDPNSMMAGSGEGLRKVKKEAQTIPPLQGQKPSVDSAYSSLNRKSPLTKPVTTHQIDLAGIKSSPSSLSSSGSESSVAHACRTERRLSTFCHECGAKYPVTAAKFCCECGVRRLSLM